jgi:hypothetical protein
MRNLLIGRTSMLLYLASLAFVAMPAVSSAKDHGRTGAAIGGAIVGGAIVSALSPRKVVVEKNIYVPTVAPAPYPTDSFSPGPGIVCYSSQRACYTVGGGYNPQWTWTVFAR